jgi:hypothetical protein
MYQQLWGYKVEEKLHLGVREQKRLNTTSLDNDNRRDLKILLQNKLIIKTQNNNPING